MYTRTIKLPMNKTITFQTDDSNELGKQMIECFNKSVPFFPKNLSDIDSTSFWQTVLENNIGNRNCTYILNNIYDSIVTPIEINILSSRNYPTDIRNIVHYMSKEIVHGRVDEWNDTNNLRIRTSELFVALLQKQIYAAYTEFQSKRLSGDENAKIFINPTTVLSQIVNSQNVQSSENINPYEELSLMTRITPIGIGGVPKSEAWPQSGMNIHSSYYGNIDPLDTPGGPMIGILQQLTIGSAITNTRGLFAEKDRQSINPLETLSIMPAVIPFVESNDGARVCMSSTQMKQAIPLKHKEIPIIQTGFESTLPSLLSDFFIKKAPVNGIITEISDLEILIKDEKNKIHTIDIKPVLLKSGQGKNGLGVFDAIVKVGQRVRQGEIVAEGSGVKNGILSTGLNMLCAFMPWYGYNFEDGMVISESAAKRFTSLHQEEHQVYISEDDEIGFSAQIGDYVKKGDVLLTYSTTLYDTETLKHLRADGGKIVNIEVYSNLPEESIPESIKSIYTEFKARYIRLHGKYPIGTFKERGKPFMGILIRYTIQQELELKKGDKLNNRAYNKGVVSCYDSETQIFTNHGWLYFNELNNYSDIKVSYMKDNGKAGFIEYDKYYESDYNGEMCVYTSKYGIDYKVTPNHRMYISPKDEEKYEIINADKMHNSNVKVKTNFDYEFDTNDTDTFKISEKINNYETRVLEFNKKDWYQFFGWWITEGCVYNGKTNANKIIITQSDVKPNNVKEITELLNRIGFTWCRSTNDSNFVLTNKVLCKYLSKFGKSWNKYIPEEMFNTNRENLQILFESMLKGDGSIRNKGKSRGFYSTSIVLINDFIRLCTLLGYRPGKIMTDTLNRKRPKYYVYFNTNKDVSEISTLTSKNYYKDNYEGKIYCVSVKNGLLFVRRNGMPFWSGNTIVPDSDMPVMPDGRRIDMIYSTLSVINRMNPGQLMEMHTSMIAKELSIIALRDSRDVFLSKYATVLDLLDNTKGKHYSKNSITKLKSMSDSMYKELLSQIKESGCVPLIFPPFASPPRENIIKAMRVVGVQTKYRLKLPTFNNKITEPICVGYMYVNKLEHLAEKKLHARSTGKYVTGTLAPTAGKKREGAQKMGEGDLYSLLGWNADIVIDELFGPQSSDHLVKNQMISEIIQKGSTNFKVSKNNPTRDIMSQMMMAIMLGS